MRIITTAVSALVIAGVGSGAALAGANGSQPASLAEAPAAFVAPAEVASSTPIRFAPGADSAKVSSTLPANSAVNYEFVARAGQQASIVFIRNEPTLRWELVGPDGKTLHALADNPVSYNTVDLAIDGTYRLQVRSDRAGAYNLTLRIPGDQAEPAAWGATRIEFAPGTDNATIDGGTSFTYRKYVFRAAAGQEATVGLHFPVDAGVEGAAWHVFAPDGSEVELHNGTSSLSTFRLEQSGDYVMRSTSATDTPYHLQFAVRDAVPAGAPTRINFAPGANSARINGGLANNPHTYVFRASAGQKAGILFTAPHGPGQHYALFAPDHTLMDQSSANQYQLDQTGDYTLNTVNDTNDAYQLLLTIPGA